MNEVPDQLHIVIDAQLGFGGNAGGIEQFTAGLVRALGRLDGPEKYTIVDSHEHPGWLGPVLGPNQRIVSVPGSPERLRMVKRSLGPLRAPLRTVLRRVRQVASDRRTAWTVPESAGFFESLGGEVVHFPHQSFIKSKLPTIYNPHDLQHRHFPGFFSPGEIARRETVYRAGCVHARFVATASLSSAEDVEHAYGVPRDRIAVVHSGAATELCEAVTEETLKEVRDKYRLPEAFALYPAQTWPHKNHLGLIQALALLRETHGLDLHVVCTGAKNRFFRTIARAAREQRVAGQLLFLGYVSARDLRALYHLARFLAFPSLFEGGALPLIEAFREGLPVACASATSLPEIAGDAAVLFDARSPQAIAEALRLMASDSTLLEALRRRGHLRAACFGWERMARTYRALYRLVANRPLSAEDRELIAASQLPPRRMPVPPASKTG